MDQAQHLIISPKSNREVQIKSGKIDDVCPVPTIITTIISVSPTKEINKLLSHDHFVSDCVHSVSVYVHSVYVHSVPFCVHSAKPNNKDMCYWTK